MKKQPPEAIAAKCNAKILRVVTCLQVKQDERKLRRLLHLACRLNKIYGRANGRRPRLIPKYRRSK